MSLWFRTGTVSCTDGSKVVTGVATFWTTAVNKPAVGDIFTADNQVIYEITKINSDSELELDRPFVGNVASGNYAIIRNTSATVNTRLAAQVSETLEKLGNKITVSTTSPSAGQGQDGDIWIVVDAGA